MITAIQCLKLFVLSAIVAYAGVFILRFWALRRNVLDIPNERSSHTRPTPRGGGLALVLVVLAGWPLASQMLGFGIETSKLLAYLGGAAGIAFISWLDDLRSVPTAIRFFVHTIGAIVAIQTFGYWTHVVIPVIGDIHLGAFGYGLTLIWIVGLTNAYNFMDGSDGIAGAQALIAGAAWCWLGAVSQNSAIVGIGLLLAGSSAGFLGHNWSPARIFMGDVGSAFLGYTFALLPLIYASSGRIGIVWDGYSIAALLFVWPFVFDSSFTFLRRLIKGERVFSAHRSHLYQRLLIAGFSHQFVALLYAALALIGFGLAAAWYYSPLQGDWAVLGGIPILCLGLWAFVNSQERRHVIAPV